MHRSCSQLRQEVRERLAAGETSASIEADMVKRKDTRLVGPPITEIVKLYAGNPAGIVQWAKAPGKKRADFPPMPSMATVGDDNLSAIADFLLR